MDDNKVYPKGQVAKEKTGKVKFIKLLLIVLLALVLVGVGIGLERYFISSDKTASSEEPTIVTLKRSDICSLLSEEKAAEVYGAKLNKSSNGNGFAAEVGNAESLGPCIFSSLDSKDLTKSAGFTYYALKYASYEEAKGYYDKQTSQLQNVEQINNLGQAALWNKSFNQLIALNDKYVLFVTSSPNSQNVKDKIISVGNILSPGLTSLE